MLLVAEQYKQEIAEIRDLYNTAEQDLKTAGRETNILMMAGVNQCRYAGQHLTRALAATDDETVKGELAAANRHLRRAVYDANDASIQYYLNQIDAFRKRFPVNLNEIIPDYGKVMEAVADARMHIEDASQRNHSNRETLYGKVRDDIQALRAAHHTLMASEPDCHIAVMGANKVKQRAWVGIAVTLVSAIALILGLL